MDGVEAPVRSILYLEDSPADAEIAREVLEEAGFQVDVVDTPCKALGRLRAGGYAALLIDHRLGRFEGSEIVLQLRDLEIPLPPTYVVSGSQEAGLADRAVSNGAIGLIRKGSYADFADALRKAVGVELVELDSAL